MAPSRTDHLLLPAEEATPPPPRTTLPYDLVLEIVARSDAATVVRSAATCKPLRRDILSPAFIRRVCSGQHGGGVVPAFLVGYLSVASSRFSLVHPAAATSGAAASFSEDHLAPFLSRRAAADVGRRYVPLASRNGLAVLRRRGLSGICVYDPMTGDRTDLPHPPDIGRHIWESYGVYYTYVLLTAADGIGCPFLLLATNSKVSRIQTAAGAAWGPVISVDKPEPERQRQGLGVFRHTAYFDVQPHSCAVVLNGLIYWLMCSGSSWDVHFYIVTYDVPRHGRSAATTVGFIEFPEACRPDLCERSGLHLTSSSSPDGRLSLLIADRFTISVWLLSSSSSSGSWARQSVIDTEAIVRSVSPHELPESERPSKVDFVRSSVGAGSGGGAVVLLRPFMNWDFLDDKGKRGLLLLDVGTEEMRRVDKKEGFLYEVDMEARLSAMKIFD